MSVLFDFSNPDPVSCPLAILSRWGRAEGGMFSSCMDADWPTSMVWAASSTLPPEKAIFGCFVYFPQAILFTKVQFQTLLALLPPTLPLITEWFKTLVMNWMWETARSTSTVAETSSPLETRIKIQLQGLWKCRERILQTVPTRECLWMPFDKSLSA